MTEAQSGATLQSAIKHHQSGQFADAHALYSRILDRDPNNVDAWHLLGLLSHQLNNHEVAAKMIVRALELRPNFAEAHSNLGTALVSLGMVDDAAIRFRRATELKPDFAAAWHNLADALRTLGRSAEAAEAYRKVLTLQPENAIANFYLCDALLRTKRKEDHPAAEAAARRVCELEPHSPVAWLMLARALRSQERTVEAGQCLEKALQLQPDNAAALMEIAGTFESWRMPDRAVEFYGRVLEREPENAVAFARMIAVYLSQCEWSDYDAFCENVGRRLRAELAADKPVSADVFNLLALPLDQAFSFRVSQQIARVAKRNVAPVKARCNFTFDRKAGERIRLGYLFPYTDSMSLPLVMEDIVRDHDRGRFEIFGYSLMACPGNEFSRRFRGHFDHFTDVVKVAPEIAARRIHADRIDILIDTTGHTSPNWLEVLALQPAPVQAHHLGYSLTTGADYVQYLISDRHFMPPEWAQFCSEKLVYMPHSFMAAKWAKFSDEPVRRTDLGLPDDAFVFANFNHPCKFEPSMFAIWMRIMRAVPNSVFWFVEWTHATADNLRREAEAAGIAGERLIFAETVDHPKHLTRIKLADLALDNRYHHGGVTNIDALWAGLPVLTPLGDRPSARLGASLTSAAGVPELICADLATYERRAIELASRPLELQAIRRKLEAGRSACPLFDAERYRLDLERGYRAMWDNYTAGRGPQQIEISPTREERESLARAI